MHLPGNLISPTTSSLLTTICSKKIYGRALGYQQARWPVLFRFARPAQALTRLPRYQHTVY